MIRTVEVKDVFKTNAYFYIDETTNHGFLIDPGAEASKLLQIIEEEQYVIEKILLTHGHFDHMGAVKQISEALKIPVFMHIEGQKYAMDPIWNLSALCERHILLNDVQYFKDNIVISLQENPNFSLQSIYIGGHTLDSTIYYSSQDQIAFVGDVIFAGTIGRSDYFGGNKTQLLKGIKEYVFTLPNDTVLYSGHSIPTTVQNEKKIHVNYL